MLTIKSYLQFIRLKKKIHSKHYLPFLKQSYKQIPRKRRTLACQCLLVGRKLSSRWICNKMVKMHMTVFPEMFVNRKQSS